MNDNIKTLRVKDNGKKDFGTLTYNVANDTFSFKYDSSVTGFTFSDIDVKNGREFSQKRMFNMFNFDDSYAKKNMIAELKLEDKSENEIQWKIKEYLAENNKMSSRGFYFEKV